MGFRGIAWKNIEILRPVAIIEYLSFVFFSIVRIPPPLTLFVDNFAQSSAMVGFFFFHGVLGRWNRFFHCRGGIARLALERWYPSPTFPHIVAAICVCLFSSYLAVVIDRCVPFLLQYNNRDLYPLLLLHGYYNIYFAIAVQYYPTTII